MYYFVISAIEILKFYLIFRFGFDISKRKFYKIGKYLDVSTIIVVVVWFITSTTMFLIPKIQESLLFYISWIFIEIVLLCKFDITKLFLMAVCSMFLIGTIDGILFIGINIIMKLMHLATGLIINVFASGITLTLVGLAIFYIPTKNKGRLKQIGRKYFFLVIAVSFINSLVTSLLWNFIVAEEFGRNSTKLAIVFVLIFFSVFFQIGLLLKLAISNNAYKDKDKMNRYYLDLQEKHYLYLEQKEKETKKFRHDIKNHMYTINNLCKDKEFEKLSDYIEGVWGKIENILGGIHVNNGVVEAILNQYESMYKNKNIELEVKGCLPTECLIDLFDLCTIFSNLMQNAYEAAGKCTGGVIRLAIRYDNNVICIREENNCINDYRSRDEKLRTDKSDSDNHGFGTVNMQECIKKYDGTFAYDVTEYKNEQKWFTVNIMMFHMEQK